MKKRWLKREIITAVHDNDLVKFLDSNGFLKKVEAGECPCAICGIPVNLDNLGAVFPKESYIYLLCDQPSCMSRIDIMLIDND